MCWNFIKSLFKRNEFDLNNDGVFDNKDASIAGRVLNKRKQCKNGKK